MIRLVLALLILGGITAGGYMVVKKNPDVLGSLTQLFQQKESSDSEEVASTDSNEGDVLGVSQENIAKVQKLVDTKITPTVQRVLGVVQDVGGIQIATNSSQKIEVAPALQSIQEQAAAIPEKILDQARYTYCKQIVADYETHR